MNDLLPFCCFRCRKLRIWMIFLSPYFVLLCKPSIRYVKLCICYVSQNSCSHVNKITCTIYDAGILPFILLRHLFQVSNSLSALACHCFYSCRCSFHVTMFDVNSMLSGHKKDTLPRIKCFLEKCHFFENIVFIVHADIKNWCQIDK